jgi:choline dehydrogenase-like flavoprotein
VQKVELHNGKAIAVNYSHGAKQHRETGKDIILCAGSINSPKLLMLSGIGDPSELARHGIGLTLESPGVGRNLRDHPLIRMTYRMKVPTDNPTEGMLQKLRIAGRFLVNGEGPIANLFEGIAFAKSAATKPLPDLQLFFLTTGHINVPNVGWQLAPYPAVMVYAAASYPRSSGRLRLSNADPETPPLIEYSLFESQEDLETLVSAVGVIRRIMGTDPIGTMVAEEIVPGQSFTDSGKLEEFVRHNTNICYHSIGTCRMGRDSAAVVDCDLRVKGTINLWVADASVMPDPISANLNAPAMMIGKKLGKHLNLRSS